MTDHDAISWGIAVMSSAGELEIPVRVKGGDYQYLGWLRSTLYKRKGAVRCVVEDENGRLFIHNPGQVTQRKHALAKLPKLRSKT